MRDPDTDDERLDELTTAVAHATHAAAEANMIRQQGIETFLIGAGVCLALIGGGFFIAMKDHAVVAPTSPTAPITTTTPAATVTTTTPAAKAVTPPEFAAAQFKGRLVADVQGRIKIEGDKGSFVLAKRDPITGREGPDTGVVFELTPLLGDEAFCNSIPGGEGLFYCFAIHDGNLVDLETQTKRVKP